MDDPLEIPKIVLQVAWPYIKLTWWFWLPPLLFVAMWELWKVYLKRRYFANLKWVLLEVKIPKQIAKPPQAMEQVFAGLHSAFRHYDFEEKYRQGLQIDYFVMEFVSIGGKMHFYAYVPKDYKNFVQSLIYSQYPDSEIKEVDDYTSALPADIPNDEWNLFGTEFTLSKPDAYPIRTYKDFLIEDISMKEEQRKVDPLSALAEAFTKLKPHEVVAIQLFIRPIDEKWKNAGEELVAKLIGRHVEKKKTGLAAFFAGVSSFFAAASPTTEKPKSSETRMLHLSPGEKEVAAAIERNIAKIGFETILRFTYIGKTGEFDMMNFAAMQGILRQFNTLNLNGFKNQSKAMTTAKWYNPWKARIKLKKKKLFYKYFKMRSPFVDVRLLKSKPFIFNIEELATVYHYPGETVGALTTQRIEAKRGEPPSNLPI